MLKKIFVLVCCLCFFMVLGGNLNAQAEMFTELKEVDKKLSDLTEEECRLFLSESKIEIPSFLSKSINVKELIRTIENNPSIVFTVNHTVVYNFLENVKSIVNKYHGIKSSAIIGNSKSPLVYSNLYSWDPNTMPYYNCYAYALGRTSACDPGDFSSYNYGSNHSIDKVANGVKSDLTTGLGYRCVKIQTTRPNSSTGWNRVIAVRKDLSGDLNGFNDYHFARMFSSVWRHKPGLSAVLTFKSAPNNSTIWTNEAYASGIYYSPTITYESNIRYILYKANHGSTTYVWTGTHYHSGDKHFYLYAYQCNDCGAYVSTVWTSLPCNGSPCITPWRVHDQYFEY